MSVDSITPLPRTVAHISNIKRATNQVSKSTPASFPRKEIHPGKSLFVHWNSGIGFGSYPSPSEQGCRREFNRPWFCPGNYLCAKVYWDAQC